MKQVVVKKWQIVTWALLLLGWMIFFVYATLQDDIDWFDIVLRGGMTIASVFYLAKFVYMYRKQGKEI